MKLRLTFFICKSHGNVFSHQMSITSTQDRGFDLALHTTSEIVGPGSYNISKSHAPEETIFPFGTTTRRDLWNLPETGPAGPGYYEPKKAKRSVSTLSNFALESGKRGNFLELPDTPSPADYVKQVQWGAKKQPISARVPVYRKDPPPPPQRPITPGPCDYDTAKDPKTNGAVFSASKSPQRDPQLYNGIPGPADYNVTQVTGLSVPVRPSPVFQSKKRGELWEYPDYDATMVAHPEWKRDIHTGRPFGANQKRELDWKIVHTPGPDVYDPKTPRSAKPKKNVGSFGSTREMYKPNKDDKPGPGYYNQTTKKKKGVSTIPRAKKPELWTIVETPSPNQYREFVQDDLKKKRIKRISSPAFKGPVERDCLTNREPNPGPAFHVKVKNQKGVREFAKAHRFADDEYIGNTKFPNSPGPADFTIEISNPLKPAHGGYINRTPNQNKNREDNPNVGPGSYGEVKCEMIKNSYNVRFDPELNRKTSSRRRVKCH